ncbi:putative membrane protein YeaQ/YmgE (transglycosylase-associated protein family) [Bradyrhizobium sp. GM24.11]
MTDCLSNGWRQGAETGAERWTGRLFALELIAFRVVLGTFAMGILAALIIGAIAGWLAGKIVHGAGFGLIGNIVVGIIGALVAGWVLPQLHIELATGTVGAIVDATVGAVIVLVILSLIKRV